jgi:choline kinase
VVVTGHLDQSIRKFLDHCTADLVVEYVHNPIYATTNNIYSLWLAGQIIQEPFLLVESDLIFEPSLLKGLREPNKIAVSRILPWMNGTTVTMGASSEVVSFNQGSAAPLNGSDYKTVNICSLSRDSWNRVLLRLEQTIGKGRVNEYYEVVFAEMVADGSLSFECVLFDPDQWYEVDRVEDLPGAERIARRINVPVKPLIRSTRKVVGTRHEFEQVGETRLDAAQR